MSEQLAKVQGLMLDSVEPRAILRSAQARVAEYEAAGQEARVIVILWPLGEEPGLTRSAMFTSEMVMAAARLQLDASDAVCQLYPLPGRSE